MTMTCDQFEDLLPQLLDDDTVAVPPVAGAHLDACGACRALYTDLTAIRSSAATLGPITPSRDLWSGIEARIRTPVVPLVEGMAIPKPRRQISLRTAAIAAGLLALINAGVGYQFMKSPAPEAPAPEVPAPSAMRFMVRQEPTMMVPLPVPMTPVSPRRSTIVLATNGVEQGPDQPQQQPRPREAAKVVYDREIARLRAIVDSGRHRLDPATAALLDRNMRIIDTAIQQVNEALARDSSSSFLIESLNNAYQTKVKLLRIAAAAASRG